MQRREFLKSGVLAGAVLGFSREGLALPQASPPGIDSDTLGSRLRSAMIWTDRLAPVPLLPVHHTPSKHASEVLPPKPPTATPEVTTDLHSAFRAEFHLAALPASAQLHLFTFTRYRLYLNGTYAGRGPSRYENKQPGYDTRDLLHLLRPGKNVLALLVHRDAPTGRIMSHVPGITALFEMRERSGQRREMRSGVAWRSIPEASFLSRRKAWSSIPENIDARRTSDWTHQDFDASHWPLAVPIDIPDLTLVPRRTPLERETLIPFTAHVSLPQKLTSPSEWSFDLPRIVQAYSVLTFDAEEGSELVVSYELPDGKSSGHSTYIARTGMQTYMSGDTFACNRLRIKIVSGRIDLTAVEVVEVLYPFELAGKFRCSDPILERLWSICARSLALLSEDAYVDCADRERVEWMDCTLPAFEVTQVAMAGPPVEGHRQWGDPRLLHALLRRIALTQMADGQVRAYTCSDRWDVNTVMEDRSCDFVIAARQYFERTGDKAFLRELWPVIVRLCNWYIAHRTARGLVLGREWEVWDNPLRYQVCEGAGLNAFAFHALRDAAFLGESLGFRDQARQLAHAASELARAFDELLWNETELTYNGALFGPGSAINTVRGVYPEKLKDGVYLPTLQAALFALDSGIVPAARLEDVRRFALAHRAEATGTMSHYYLFKIIYSMGSSELDVEVLRIIRNKWLPQVESPWQTTWETLQPNQGSKVHIYGVLPAYFLSSYVLGVRQSDASLLIEPRCGDLLHAEGTVVTKFGPVPISWKRVGASLEIVVTIPRDSNTKLVVRAERSDTAFYVNKSLVHGVRDGKHITLSLREGCNDIRCLYIVG